MVLTRELVRRKQRTRTKHISIRIPYSLDNWIKKNDFSPTRILLAACRELGYNQVDEDKKMSALNIHSPRKRTIHRKRR